ncbi:MAG TPA: hypothetical protein PLB90_02370 [Opitutaceae bacterium]|nr:hypothetical protein [Opitutaceae bacterium]
MRIPPFIRRVVFALLAATAVVLRAQPVVNTEQDKPQVPQAVKEKDSFSLPSPPPQAGNPFKWGDFEVRPFVTDRFVYSDGILSGTGHPTNTYINSLSTGFQLNAGKHWLVEYSPTWMVYTNRQFNNSVDHRLHAGGGLEIGNWFFKVDEQYTSTNSPRIETASQVKQDVTTTVLSLSHRLGQYLTIEITGAQTLQFIEKSPDYYDWSTQDWLSYRIAARLDLSVGYRLGYTDFDPGAFMISSQRMARLRWRPTDKITFAATGGREHRKVHKQGIAAEDSPTFDLSMDYQPFDHTKVSLSGNKSVRPSFFENGVTKSKSWNVELEQRLLGKLTLTAGYGQEWSHFLGSHRIFIPSVSYEDILDDDGNVIGTLTITNYNPATAIDRRNDAIDTFHARLSLPVLRRGTLAVIYQRLHDESTKAGYSFTSNQVGCEFSYKF